MSYDESNVFARIVRGEIPCDKVYEDEHVLAFRDIQPQAPVHVLVIPKGPYRDIDHFGRQASDEEVVAWTRAIGRVARELGLDEQGYRVLSNKGEHGHQEVPHLHLHLMGGCPMGAMVSRRVRESERE